MNVESLFLQISVKKLREFMGHIEACVAKLNDEQIWLRGGENENAIGNLALHLAGNVRQWIVSTLGSDAAIRDRDAEFDARGGSGGPELLAKLRSTVEQAAGIVAKLDTDRLTRTYEIQGYRVTGVEVVYHVVEHFAEHTGQIVFITKAITGHDLGFYGHLRNPSRSVGILSL